MREILKHVQASGRKLVVHRLDESSGAVACLSDGFAVLGHFHKVQDDGNLGSQQNLRVVTSPDEAARLLAVTANPAFANHKCSLLRLRDSEEIVAPKPQPQLLCSLPNVGAQVNPGAVQDIDQFGANIKRKGKRKGAREGYEKKLGENFRRSNRGRIGKSRIERRGT